MIVVGCWSLVVGKTNPNETVIPNHFSGEKSAVVFR